MLKYISKAVCPAFRCEPYEQGLSHSFLGSWERAGNKGLYRVLICLRAGQGNGKKLRYVPMPFSILNFSPFLLS